MSRFRTATAIAVRWPFTSRQVLAALSATHDDEPAAETLLGIAATMGIEPSSVVATIKEYRRRSDVSCELGPADAMGYCRQCGAHVIYGDA